jgi:hypothetical protein
LYSKGDCAGENKHTMRAGNQANKRSNHLAGKTKKFIRWSNLQHPQGPEVKGTSLSEAKKLQSTWEGCNTVEPTLGFLG